MLAEDTSQDWAALRQSLEARENTDGSSAPLSPSASSENLAISGSPSGERRPSTGASGSPSSGGGGGALFRALSKANSTASGGLARAGTSMLQRATTVINVTEEDPPSRFIEQLRSEALPPTRFVSVFKRTLENSDKDWLQEFLDVRHATCYLCTFTL